MAGVRAKLQAEPEGPWWTALFRRRGQSLPELCVALIGCPQVFVVELSPESGRWWLRLVAVRSRGRDEFTDGIPGDEVAETSGCDCIFKIAGDLLRGFLRRDGGSGALCSTEEEKRETERLSVAT